MKRDALQPLPIIPSLRFDYDDEATGQSAQSKNDTSQTNLLDEYMRYSARWPLAVA